MTARPIDWQGRIERLREKIDATSKERSRLLATSKGDDGAGSYEACILTGLELALAIMTGEEGE